MNIRNIKYAIYIDLEEDQTKRGRLSSFPFFNWAIHTVINVEEELVELFLRTLENLNNEMVE